MSSPGCGLLASILLVSAGLTLVSGHASKGAEEGGTSLALRWSETDIVATASQDGECSAARVSAGQLDSPQIAWIVGSDDQSGRSVMWSVLQSGRWSRPKTLNGRPGETDTYLQLGSDASGVSLVCWREGVLYHIVENHAVKGLWPTPTEIRGTQGTVSPLGGGVFRAGPARVELFYTEFVTGFLPETGSYQLLAQSLKGGQWSAPQVVARRLRFEEELAFNLAANGDGVLVFAASPMGFFGQEGACQLFVATRAAGKESWTTPRSVGELDPHAFLSTVACWAESGSTVWIAYHVSFGFDGRQELHLVSPSGGKGMRDTVLKGWPAHRPAADERLIRIVRAADGSLVLLHGWGQWLELARWNHGEVLETGEHSLPGNIADVDIDSLGQLHVVGISGEGLWYKRAVPAWAGK